MSPVPRIAIVGGGLAALTLGCILQLKQIPFTIFEREVSAVNRSQGGTLDLDKGSGQLALQIAGPFDKFRAYMRMEGQAQKLANKHGKWIMQHFPQPTDESRPEIDRGDLRQIFSDVIGDNITWNSHVKSVSKLQGGSYQLGLADGSSHILRDVAQQR
jgi:2-polyprenyl-6-methoxyphenol hydroxylase-like FAD-dependent oxidoreductase